MNLDTVADGWLVTLLVHINPMLQKSISRLK